jgi:metallo-beta-lactamase family protein
LRKVSPPYVAPGQCLSRVCFLGAVNGDVTGSLHLVELIEHEKVTRILVDVGQTVENPKADFQNRLPNGLTVEDIDIIILTHAHLDHSGLVPRFYKLGYRGKVYVTRATGDLLEILLPDSGKIAEEEAKRETNREAKKSLALVAEAAERAATRAVSGKSKTIRKSTREAVAPKKVEPLYTMDDAKASLSLLERMDFGRRYELARGVVLQFVSASHILGAAMVHLELGWNGSKRSFLFAGNIGRDGMPLLRNIVHTLPSDFIAMESTYGDKLHMVRDDLAALAHILKPALERASKPNKKGGHGVVLIPVFSVGRAQVLLDRIRRLKAAGTLCAGLKVYLDSPMSIKVTEVHRREEHRHLFNAETQEVFASGGDPFRFPGLTEVSEFRKELLEAQTEPCIILCSPGMGNGGRALSQIAARVEFDSNTILLVGYQGRGTIGSALLDARAALLESAKKGGKRVARYVNIMNVKKRVNATIEFMGDYSAHGDYQDIIRLLHQASAQRTPRMIFLEHGDQEAVDGLQEHVSKLLGLKSCQPKLKEWFNLN